MEENENVIEELKKIYPNRDKKKKKFVYLDKYQDYVQGVQEVIESLRYNLNICYLLIAGLIVAVVTLAIIK